MTDCAQHTSNNQLSPFIMFIRQLPTMTSQTAYDDKNVNSRKHPGLSIVAIGNQQTMHASSRGGAQIRLNWQI